MGGVGAGKPRRYRDADAVTLHFGAHLLYLRRVVPPSTKGCVRSVSDVGREFRFDDAMRWSDCSIIASFFYLPRCVTHSLSLYLIVDAVEKAMAVRGTALLTALLSFIAGVLATLAMTPSRGDSTCGVAVPAVDDATASPKPPPENNPPPLVAGSVTAGVVKPVERSADGTPMLATMAFVDAAQGSTTDKVVYHRYQHMYDRLFAQLSFEFGRTQPPADVLGPSLVRVPRVLEIGIGNGGSFHTLSKLFGGLPLLQAGADKVQHVPLAEGEGGSPWFYRGVDIRTCTDKDSVTSNTLLPAAWRDHLCAKSTATVPKGRGPDGLPTFDPAGADSLLRVKRSTCDVPHLATLINNAPEQGGLLSSDAPGFDVVVDDASHISQCTALTFLLVFPSRLLAPGGVFVIEDIAFAALAGWQKPGRPPMPADQAADLSGKPLSHGLSPEALRRLVSSPINATLLELVGDMHQEALHWLSEHPQQKWVVGKGWTAAKPTWPFSQLVQRVECEREVCAIWKKPDPTKPSRWRRRKTQ